MELVKGCQFIVVIIDLDKCEIVFWNFGVIVGYGGFVVCVLFCDVFVVLVSVLGVFFLMLIWVYDGLWEYDEMYVDGGIIILVFSMLLIVGIQLSVMFVFKGVYLYIIVNG